MSAGQKPLTTRSDVIRQLEQQIRAGGNDAWLAQMHAKLQRFLLARYGDQDVPAEPSRLAPDVRSLPAPTASLSLERKKQIRVLLEGIHAR